MLFKIGDYVDREIEGMWFSAIVEDVEIRRRQMRLKYLDDGNVEEYVPMNDCRFSTMNGGGEGKDTGEGKDSREEGKLELGLDGSYETKGDSKRDDYDWSPKKMDIAVVVGSPKDTLKKPLLGLIEDDSEQRRNHVHKSVIHSGEETEEAIILHGAEHRMAAGGGLRALRFLKDKDSA